MFVCGELDIADRTVGVALCGHPIGGNNAVESDRVATEGHPYN